MKWLFNPYHLFFIRCHGIMLTLWKYPINHFIKALAAEIKLHVLKIMSRSITNLSVKAEIPLMIPKVKCLSTHITNLCWVFHELNK